MKGKHFMNDMYKFPNHHVDYMLLSYKKFATASTSKNEHEPCFALDGNKKTFWSSKSGKAGEWFMVDLGAVKTVHAVRFDCTTKDAVFSLFGSTDGKEYELLFSGKNEAVPLDGTINFENQQRLRFLKLLFLSNDDNNCFTVNDFKVLGFGNGYAPEKVEQPFAIRTSDNEAVICWNRVSTAVGYKVRLGTSPEELDECRLVYGEDSVSIDSLTDGQTEYYYAVDSFNENGVTKGDIRQMGAAKSELYRIQ